MSNGTKIVSRIVKTEEIDWTRLEFLQAEDFKELSEADEVKLRNSIISNNFTDPFYVWQDEQTIYCLDGKHRTRILLKLIREGIDVPLMLPATFIHCKSKKEAAELVLQYSSQYAKATYSGMHDFLSTYDLPLVEMMERTNLPEIQWNALLNDVDKDFSIKNHELDLEEFKNVIVLKLSFPKEEYLSVKARLEELMILKGISCPEDLLKHLLDL